MRTVRVDGYIVSDAERRISKSGKEYLYFRIGNNEFNDEKGEDGKPKRYWFTITSFNQRHFSMAQHLIKGKPIIVEGDWSDRIYQNNEGNCEISRDVMANAIYFCKGSENNDNAPKKDFETPVTQTAVAAPKPTTAELKVPQTTSQQNNDDDIDDLPF